ncbi:MAG: dephospho-CoA kinase [Pseudomonadota bacterium]
MAGYAVGLTGGIASGKSAVAARFAALGITVVDADLVAREVVAPGTEGLAALVEAFGQDILDPTGALDRRRMRERVFADDAARARLEAILHPRIRGLLGTHAGEAPGAYVVVAIPLLAEGGGRTAYPWLDRVLVVDVPEATQLARLAARDRIDEVLARRMLEAQATRAQRLAIADDVVVNAGGVEELDRLVAALDRRYRQLAEAKASPAT